MDGLNSTRGVGKYSFLFFGEEAMSALFELRYIFGALVILIAVDYYFGMRESVARGEKIRLSRSWRRTMNKFVDYLSFPIVGLLVGLSICEPLGVCSAMQCTAVFASVVVVCEINSILGHFLRLKGVKFDLIKASISLLKSKHEDLGEAKEEGLENVEKKKD